MPSKEFLETMSFETVLSKEILEVVWDKVNYM